MMHYLVVTVWHVLGTTVVQVVFALEHHSLAFRAKSATTTRVALSPVTALFRMVELRSVLPMAPYVHDFSARYKAVNSYLLGCRWHSPQYKISFFCRKKTKWRMDQLKGIACPTPSNRATYLTFSGGNGSFQQGKLQKKVFAGHPRDFFGFWFAPPFDHLSHFNSGEPPSTLVYLAWSTIAPLPLSFYYSG